MTKIPSPEAIILIICAVALCAMPQALPSYDQNWLLIANVLFVAAVTVYLKGRVAKLPGSQGRIVVSAEVWNRAKNGLVVGVVCALLGVAWISWSPAAQSGLDTPWVAGPTILLEAVGAILIVYWIALWTVGQVQKKLPSLGLDKKSDH